jgi:hypothetical protein
MARKATFTGLSREEEYFPMISRNEPQAFFGLAPAAVRPKEPTHLRESLPARDTPPMHRGGAKDNSREDREDLYNSPSDSGGEFMDVDRPHSSPSTRAPVARARRNLSKRGDDGRPRSLSATNSPEVKTPKLAPNFRSDN